MNKKIFRSINITILLQNIGICILIGLLCSCSSKVSKLNEEALSAMEQGDLDNAAGLLEEAIEIRAEIPELHANLAEIYFRQNNINKAYVEIKKAIEYAQNPKPYYKAQAIYSIKAEKWDTARNALNELLKTNESNGELKSLEGLVLLKEEKIEEAEKAFLASLKENPKNCTSMLGLARIKILQKDLNNAWNLTVEVDNQNVQDMNVQADLAAVYSLLGKDDKASKILTDVAGQNYELHLELANIYYRKKEWGLATSEYVKAQTLQPNLLEAQMGLAKVYYQTDKLEKVLEITKIILDKNPKLYEALNLRGLAYLKRGQRYPAKQVLEESLKIKPNQVEIQIVYEGIK